MAGWTVVPEQKAPAGWTPVAEAPSAKATQQTLAQLIRAKYPNAYTDMSDAALETAILAKYPEYSDLPRTLPTERAMQQTMGGPPMFVDVPKGQGAAFEQAGKEGYQTGGIIGAGLVAGAGTAGAALASPAGAATANFLINAVKSHPIVSGWVATHLANYLGIPLPKIVKAIAGIREVAEP